MKLLTVCLIAFSVACILLASCSKYEEPVLSTRLHITVVDDSSKAVSGATVRLYKNTQDTGITQLSDTAGNVLFLNLEPRLYYWLAEKGCKTNRNSQMALDRPLIEGVILYGRSVMTETGILKIINTSTDSYKVTDSVFTITLAKDTTYIVYPKVGKRTIYTEKIASAGTIKDTSIQIRCGDTSILRIPF